MKSEINIQTAAALKDIRTQWLKAGEAICREGNAAAVEIISTVQDRENCRVTVIVTPYAPPSDVNPEKLQGAREAVEFASRSSHPRVRAAAEIASASLAAPPAGDLEEISVELWLDLPESWSPFAQLNLNSDGEAYFENVPIGADCWIELMLSQEFSPDGRWMVSRSHDNSVKVWEAATGQLVADCLGHTDLVMSVAFSPDGRWLASGSWDRSVKVWEAATGQLVASCLGHTKRVTSVAFSPDGRWLVSGSSDKSVKVWEAATGRLVANCLGQTGSVDSVAFSADGRWVVSGSNDKNVKVWEAATGQLVEDGLGHTSRITGVASIQRHVDPSSAFEPWPETWEESPDAAVGAAHLPDALAAEEFEQSGPLRLLRYVVPENLEGITIEFSADERNCLWLTAHTPNRALTNTLLRFILGPARGNVILRESPTGCEGMSQIKKMPVNKLDRFLPHDFRIAPVQQ